MPPQIFEAASDYADELRARAERAEAEVLRLRQERETTQDELEACMTQFRDLLIKFRDLSAAIITVVDK